MNKKYYFVGLDGTIFKDRGPWFTYGSDWVLVTAKNQSFASRTARSFWELMGDEYPRKSVEFLTGVVFDTISARHIVEKTWKKRGRKGDVHDR